MAIEDHRSKLQGSVIRWLAIVFNKKWFLRTISVAAVLLIWSWFSNQLFFLASPLKILYALINQVFIEQTLLWAIIDALKHAVAGYLLAVAIGVPLGFLIGFSDVARNILNPLVDAFYVTPMVAIVPLIIIWFGIGIKPKIFLVFIFAVFIIIINTEAGVTETPEGLVHAAKVFGANNQQVYTEVHLRHSLPHILTGLRLGSGRAIRGMVVAELFISADELGSYLVQSGAQFEIAKLLAGVVFLAILGYTVISLFRLLEDLLLQYRETTE